ncbi:hypothetical protein HKX48_008937 [Thoreauomyces humboldtii]|nr:hypothetical protein HKX48_008937 [Thoreauomyces humboldtii]
MLGWQQGGASTAPAGIPGYEGIEFPIYAEPQITRPVSDSQHTLAMPSDQHGNILSQQHHHHLQPHRNRLGPDTLPSRSFLGIPELDMTSPYFTFTMRGLPEGLDAAAMDDAGHHQPTECACLDHADRMLLDAKYAVPVDAVAAEIFGEDSEAVERFYKARGARDVQIDHWLKDSQGRWVSRCVVFMTRTRNPADGIDVIARIEETQMVLQHEVSVLVVETTTIRTQVVPETDATPTTTIQRCCVTPAEVGGRLGTRLRVHARVQGALKRTKLGAMTDETVSRPALERLMATTRCLDEHVIKLVARYRGTHIKLAKRSTSSSSASSTSSGPPTVPLNTTDTGANDILPAFLTRGPKPVSKASAPLVAKSGTSSRTSPSSSLTPSINGHSAPSSSTSSANHSPRPGTDVNAVVDKVLDAQPARSFRPGLSPARHSYEAVTPPGFLSPAIRVEAPSPRLHHHKNQSCSALSKKAAGPRPQNKVERRPGGPRPFGWNVGAAASSRDLTSHQRQQTTEPKAVVWDGRTWAEAHPVVAQRLAAAMPVGPIISSSIPVPARTAAVAPGVVAQPSLSREGGAVAVWTGNEYIVQEGRGVDRPQKAASLPREQPSQPTRVGTFQPLTAEDDMTCSTTTGSAPPSDIDEEDDQLEEEYEAAYGLFAELQPKTPQEAAEWREAAQRRLKLHLEAKERVEAVLANEQVFTTADIGIAAAASANTAAVARPAEPTGTAAQILADGDPTYRRHRAQQRQEHRRERLRRQEEKMLINEVEGTKSDRQGDSSSYSSSVTTSDTTTSSRISQRTLPRGGAVMDADPVASTPGFVPIEHPSFIPLAQEPEQALPPLPLGPAFAVFFLLLFLHTVGATYPIAKMIWYIMLRFGAPIACLLLGLATATAISVIR